MPVSTQTIKWRAVATVAIVSAVSFAAAPKLYAAEMEIPSTGMPLQSGEAELPGAPLGLDQGTEVKTVSETHVPFVGAPADPFKDEVALFQQEVAKLGAKKDCEQVPVAEKNDVTISYFYCSRAAMTREQRARKLTKNFTVPSALALRTKFWERVFSEWSIDESALHVGAYPEVVLEIASGAKVDSPNAEIRKYRAQGLLLSRVDAYRDSFLALDKMKHGAKIQPTKTMLRLAALMKHIKDPDKYSKAAESMRIQRGQKDFLKRGIEVASRYLGRIENEFISRGLPKELSRLAFIESTFNPDAVSSVGASGVYQIMPETGRHYMFVNETIDERRDPIKAGTAAAEILSFYHDLTGNWPLAVTAYNHGVGSIRRAIQVTGSDSFTDILQSYDAASFGFASKNFYSEFLAMVSIMNDVDSHFENLAYQQPLEFDDIEIDKAEPMSKVLAQYQLEVDEVLAMNPDLSEKIIAEDGELPRGYVLKVPARFQIQKISYARIPGTEEDDGISRLLVGH